MFDSIQRGLKEALGRFRGRGRLTADNIREGLREVRRAFLEADVNFNVTNDFIARVEAQAVGQNVLERVNPADQIVKIVFDELVQLMGPVDHKIPVYKDRPAVLMMCGLQGSGKTTTCAKLALKLRDQGRRPLLVAADLQRPAAVDQLKVLGQQTNIPVYSEATNPVQVCKNAIAYAKQHSLDVIILDTAGRLQIDQELMDELNQIDRQVQPDHVYLVVDAMIGQEAVNVAKTFNDVGEKLQALEEFRPESMASRIMGQGDLMGLVEKVQQIQAQVSEEQLQKQQEALEKGQFTLDDFRMHFQNIQK